jgi:hypothetical protein
MAVTPFLRIEQHPYLPKGSEISLFIISWPPDEPGGISYTVDINVKPANCQGFPLKWISSGTIHSKSYHEAMDEALTNVLGKLNVFGGADEAD